MASFVAVNESGSASLTYPRPYLLADDVIEQARRMLHLLTAAIVQVFGRR
jgi:hypothetical protein